MEFFLLLVTFCSCFLLFYIIINNSNLILQRILRSTNNDRTNRSLIEVIKNIDPNSVNTYSNAVCILQEYDINEQDSMGWTSLHWAIKRMLDEVANALIILGADINIQNVDGNTPLHFAAMFENDSVLLCLLENNSLTDIRNRWGNIAADILRIKKHRLRNRHKEIHRNRVIIQMLSRLRPIPPKPPIISRAIKPVINENLNLSEVFTSDECCICTKLFDTDVCVTGECKHVFHSGCINDWFHKSINNICPLCKTNIYNLILLNNIQVQQLKNRDIRRI